MSLMPGSVYPLPPFYYFVYLYIMTPNKDIVIKLLNSLVKKEFPEIIRFAVKFDDHGVFQNKFTHVNVYFDYLDWWKKNGEGKYGPNDYRVIEELEESIESYVKNALRYIGINRSIVNVLEDDEISSNND